MTSYSEEKRIYFAAAVSATICSIENGLEAATLEKDMWVGLYQHIKSRGRVTNPLLWEDVMKKASEEDEAPNSVYTYSIDNGVLKSSHVVAEVSRLSHGVGMELGFAIASGIPVLCLYRSFEGGFPPADRLSRMIRGAPVTLTEYRSLDEAKDAIDRFFEQH